MHVIDKFMQKISTESLQQMFYKKIKIFENKKKIGINPSIVSMIVTRKEL